MYAIIEAPHRGWASSTSLVWFGIAAVLVAAFLMWELRNTAPMLNLRYFLDPRFGVAAGVITLVFFGMFGFFFLLTQYFQLVLGYGTLEAGVKQLPFAAVMMVVAPNSPKFAARFGANVAVAIGLVGMSAGMFLFTIARTDTSYLRIVLVVMVMAAGMAMTIPTMTGLDHVGGPDGQGRRRLRDERHHPRARRRARCRGARQPRRVSLRLPAVAGARPASCSAAGQAGESLAGALHAATDPSVSDGARVVTIAKEAFVSGMHLAAIIAGCVALLAAGIVYRKLPAGNPHAKGAASLTRPSADLAEF